MGAEVRQPACTRLTRRPSVWRPCATELAVARENHRAGGVAPALRQLPILEVRVSGESVCGARARAASPVVFATALHVVAGFVSEDRC